MTFHLAPLGDDDVARICAWRYPPPYDVYEVDAQEAAAMTDPKERFFAVLRDGDLVAYACLGAEARVRGLEPEPGTEDLGVAMRPDLMGQGLSRELLPWLVDALAPERGDAVLRVVILDWNARSLAAYRRTGFVEVGTHANSDRTYRLLIMKSEKPRSPTGRTDRDV